MTGELTKTKKQSLIHVETINIENQNLIQKLMLVHSRCLKTEIPQPEPSIMEKPT